MEGSFRLVLSDTETKKKGDIIDEPDMINLAQKVNLVEGAGAHWKCMGEAFGSKSLIERKLMTDSVFKRQLSEALMTVLLT